MARPDYVEALRRADVLCALARFDPHVAGTPPLGLDLPSSDIDILCHAPDPDVFPGAAWSAFRHHDGLSIRQWTGEGRPIVCTFRAHGWAFELFGQNVPVARQAGWRHFLVEQRLLALGGTSFRAAVMAARRAGFKTEPAFATALGLAGDPYPVLLDLGEQADGHLAAVLRTAGFHAAGGTCAG